MHKEPKKKRGKVGYTATKEASLCGQSLFFSKFSVAGGPTFFLGFEVLAKAEGKKGAASSGARDPIARRSLMAKC